jgi:thioredoxin reductase (NADPH)
MRAPDLLIVGAGPAGSSAALWAASLDLAPLLLEADARAGGQLHRIHFEPRNLAGGVSGDGAAIAARAREQLTAAGVEVRTESRAAGLHEVPGGIEIRTERGDTITAPAALVATGLRRRTLGIPGEAALMGRGVTDSATRDRDALADRDVIVIGGGDAAYENALLLDSLGCRVTLAIRGPVHARRAFQGRVAARPAIVTLHDAQALEIIGVDAVRAVRFRTPAGEIERRTDAVVIKAGQVPNTEWCAGALALDPDGFVRVDAALRTSLARVFAAGDITRPAVAGIAVAEGQGALVAAHVARLRAEDGDA